MIQLVCICKLICLGLEMTFPKNFTLNKSTIVILFLLVTFVMPFGIQAAQIEVLHVDDFLFNLNRSLRNLNVQKKLPVKMEITSLKNNNSIHVYSKGPHGEVVRQIVFDPEHKLMKGKKFTLKNRAKKGSHQVGFCSVGDDGEMALCFKQNPEVPHLEIARNLLLQEIVSSVGPKYKKDVEGMELPETQVIVMNKCVFSVSKFIHGQDLEDIVLEPQKIEKLAGSFNQTQLLMGIIEDMMSMPEDNRPQNMILVYNSKTGKFSLTSIDAERTFGPPYNEKDGVITRAHSFRFGLPQMHEVVPTDIFHMPCKALKRWRRGISAEYCYQRKLKECARVHTQSIGLSILPESYVRVWKARKIINDGIAAGKKTPMEMLGEISLDLAKVYEPTKIIYEKIRQRNTINNMIGKLLNDMLDRSSADLVIAYMPTTSYLSSLYTADTDDEGSSDDDSTDEALKDKHIIGEAEIGNDINSPSFLTAKSVLSLACFNTLIVDPGRVSKKTPKSAGTVETIYGRDAHKRAVLQHPNLLRIVEQHFENSTPDSSPIPDGSPRNALVSPMGSPQLVTRRLASSGQDSQQHTTIQLLPIIPGQESNLQIKIGTQGTVSPKKSSPGKKPLTPNIQYRTITSNECSTTEGDTKESLPTPQLIRHFSS